ncbi:MAG: hypothetical protein PHN74_00250 [Candidatus Pacebacteria bacterium]|nr:hypothetical protein [Candidatus Paceibacterota bacterium]
MIKSHPIRFIIIFLILAAAAFVLFDKKNTTVYSIPFLSMEEKNSMAGTLDKVREAGGEGVDVVSEKATQAKDAVINKGNEVVSGAVKAVKKQAFDLFKKTVNEEIDNLGKDLKVESRAPSSIDNTASIINVAGGSDSVETHPEVIFSIQPNSLAYFTIKNIEEENIKFEINWQDGESKNGTINKGDTMILSHGWSKSGNYLVEFKIITTKETKGYNIPVTIF